MAMSAKSHEQLVAKAGALIQPDERIVHTLYAAVGTTPIKKNLGAIAAAAAVGVAVAAATGGAAAGIVPVFSKGRVYIAVTDRSVLVFAGRRHKSGPGDLLAYLPRGAVTAGVRSDRLAYKLRLEIAGSDQALRLTFAPIPRGLKDSGRRLAALLQQPTPVRDSSLDQR